MDCFGYELFCTDARPEKPETGAVWVDKSNGNRYIFNGEEWMFVDTFEGFLDLPEEL